MKKKISMYSFVGSSQGGTPSKPKKKVSPTNLLTNKIIDYINVQVHSYAFRVNTMGTWRKDLEKYVHSGSTLGVSDVIAIYHGRFIGLEIKQGSDKLNHKQQKFADRVAGSLGNYYEIRSFDQFLQVWKDLTESIDKYDDATIQGLMKRFDEKPPFA